MSKTIPDPNDFSDKDIKNLAHDIVCDLEKVPVYVFGAKEFVACVGIGLLFGAVLSCRENKKIKSLEKRLDIIEKRRN